MPFKLIGLSLISSLFFTFSATAATCRGHDGLSAYRNSMYCADTSGRLWTQLTPVAKSWQEAKDACLALELEGYRDWNLPDMEQLTYLTTNTSARESFPGVTDLLYTSLESYNRVTAYYFPAKAFLVVAKGNPASPICVHLIPRPVSNDSGGGSTGSGGGGGNSGGGYTAGGEVYGGGGSSGGSVINSSGQSCTTAQFCHECDSYGKRLCFTGSCDTRYADGRRAIEHTGRHYEDCDP